MKNLIIWLLCMTVLLWGCTCNSTYKEVMKVWWCGSGVCTVVFTDWTIGTANVYEWEAIVWAMAHKTTCK